MGSPFVPVIVVVIFAVAELPFIVLAAVTRPSLFTVATDVSLEL